MKKLVGSLEYAEQGSERMKQGQFGQNVMRLDCNAACRPVSQLTTKGIQPLVV